MWLVWLSAESLLAAVEGSGHFYILAQRVLSIFLCRVWMLTFYLLTFTRNWSILSTGWLQTLVISTGENTSSTLIVSYSSLWSNPLVGSWKSSTDYSCSWSRLNVVFRLNLREWKNAGNFIQRMNVSFRNFLNQQLKTSEQTALVGSQLCSLYSLHRDGEGCDPSDTSLFSLLL